MDSSWELFENAGTKIRNLAVGLFAIEAIAAILGGIVMIMGDSDLFFFGILTIVVGIGVAYLSALLLSAFGELVESSTENMKINSKILDIMTEKDRPASAKTAPVTRPTPIDPTQYTGTSRPAAPAVPNTWVCQHCGTTNKTNTSMCKGCGQYR